LKASGSSSGCAVAVALGLCFAAIGAEVRFNVVHGLHIRATLLSSQLSDLAIIDFELTRNLISSEGINHASKRLVAFGNLTWNFVNILRILYDLI
jgi:amidase